MLPEQIIYFAVTLNLIGHLLYIGSIVKGHAKPNLVSWFFWMLAPFVGVFLQLRAGAGWSMMGVFMAGFAPLLVVIFSLVKGNVFWKIQTLDIVCGLFSVVALIIYVATNNLAISIFFAIVSDFLAYIPTYIKTWKNPETETGSVYLGGIINNFISLLIIKNWVFAIYSFPIYLILANIVEISLIYRKRISSYFSS